MKTKIFGIGVFFLTAIIAAAVWLHMQEPKVGGDYTLQHLDSKWTFSEHAKPLNILYFGYVKCPDVCPMSLSNTGQAFRHLSEEERKKVQVTFVSVDAANDTPKSVADYADQFFSGFVGLTGSESDIQKVVDLFGASYMIEKDAKSYLGYTISHTDRLFFLNQNGVVIDTIPNPRSAPDIVAKIRSLL